MLNLLDPSRIRNLLCLGAHCDDIEIGAGGTLLKWLAEAPGMRVHWVVFGGQDSRRRAEAEHAARLILGNADANVSILTFRDAFMPYDPTLKEAFEQIKKAFEPDLILTHHGDDRHQDHRQINQLTWNTWRNHAILEYEIFKYDGDLSRPNVYVPLGRELVQKKVSYLREAFASQRDKQWFTADVFEGLMRLRGVECNSPTQFAEAFHARKLVL